MNSQTIPPMLETTGAVTMPPLLEKAEGTRARPRWQQAVFFPLKFWLGMIACQSLIGGIALIGWTYRLMQRFAFRYWWSRSSRKQQGETFDAFLAQDESTKTLRQWPNWILQQDFLETVRQDKSPMHMAKALIHSLWTNLKIGTRGIFNTWALTLPGCIIMWFSWYDGWNNSFAKGYEQAPVGPLLGFVGIFLFIGGMFYVPMAQARQATTGEWRSFFQFKLIWGLIRQRWLASVVVAGLYSLASIPLMVMRSAPMFLVQSNPKIESFTPAQALAYLNHYYFMAALWVLPAFVILHLISGRIYAAGLLRGVQTGQISLDELSPVERSLMERLNLANLQPQPERPIFVRAIAWAGTRAGRVVAGFVLFWLWFSFIAQVYVSEFLNYHVVMGWVNQPLAQVPWFHYLPYKFSNPGFEYLGAAGLLLLILLGRRVIRAIRKVKAAI